MTCIEKLKEMHPGWDDDRVMDIVLGCCPCYGDYHYIPQVNDGACDEMTCIECWNQEIPDDVHMHCGNLDITKHADGSSTMIFTGEEPKPEVPTAPHILDSGDRTQFESGAVRDMREGKGRCDLTPLEVVSKMIDPDGDTILDCIRDFQKTRDSRHLYDALNTFTAAFSNQMETLILEVAKHFEEGAKKYGPDNWRRGLPVWCYIDSAVRHYLKWLRGDQNEPHDRAFCWNLMCCIWEVDYHKTTVDEKVKEEKNA